MQWTAYFFSILIFYSSMSVAADRGSSVRVRIKTASGAVSLSGLSIRFFGLETKFRQVAQPQNRRVDITRVSIANRTYWQISQGEVSLNQNVMSPQDSLLIEGESLRQGNTDLPNKILLQQSADGQIDVVGVVPLEEYVQAVLVNEMPLGWPLETLKAQAVAIRSYTQAVMRERSHRDFHVESSVLDQVYRKVQAGLDPELLRKARLAVQETAGVTLLNLKRHPLKAYYHSDCGGKTVSASSVWKQETENDVGVASDEFCATNPRSQWKLTMAKQKLADLLKNFAGDLRSNEFRKLVGFMQLKSTKFEIFQKTDKKSDENNKDEIEFVGRGFGHGVGMCQWGSKDLGARGFSYQRILQHYYPLATFQFRR